MNQKFLQENGFEIECPEFKLQKLTLLYKQFSVHSINENVLSVQVDIFLIKLGIKLDTNIQSNLQTAQLSTSNAICSLFNKFY